MMEEHGPTTRTLFVKIEETDSRPALRMAFANWAMHLERAAADDTVASLRVEGAVSFDGAGIGRLRHIFGLYEPRQWSIVLPAMFKISGPFLLPFYNYTREIDGELKFRIGLGLLGEPSASITFDPAYTNRRTSFGEFQSSWGDVADYDAHEVRHTDGLWRLVDGPIEE